MRLTGLPIEAIFVARQPRAVPLIGWEKEIVMCLILVALCRLKNRDLRVRHKVKKKKKKKKIKKIFFFFFFFGKGVKFLLWIFVRLQEQMFFVRIRRELLIEL